MSASASPPALRDVVGWTLPDMLAGLRAADLEMTARPRPQRFASALLGDAPRAMSLEGGDWSVAGGLLDLRAARIRTGKVDVATVMLYPTSAPEALPIVAAEWVAVGEALPVIVLDVETAGAQPQLVEQLRPLMEPLAARWQPRFPGHRERPAWFEEIAQPWAIYGSCELAAIDALQQAFRETLEVMLPWIAARLPALPARGSAEHEQVRAYKAHHADHSPAAPLLSRWMPPEDVDLFLREHHFGPAS